MTGEEAETLLTVREAAEVLRVSQETIRRRIRAGDLPAVHLGRKVIRIRRADLAAIQTPTNSASLEAHIADLVAKAPPLTPEQRDKLAILFRSPGGVEQ